MKRTVYKATQGYKYYHDENFLCLVPLYFQHNINLIEKDYGKTKCRSIYGVISELYFEEGKVFTKEFVKRYFKM